MSNCNNNFRAKGVWGILLSKIKTLWQEDYCSKREGLLVFMILLAKTMVFNDIATQGKFATFVALNSKEYGYSPWFCAVAFKFVFCGM